MIDSFASWTTLAAAIGGGIVAGFFFAFSNCVMSALGRLPAEQGIRAMQSINVLVLNPAFFLAFFGTALASLALAIVSILRWGREGAALALAGGLIYLLGTILATMARNVPLNEALAEADPSTPEAASLWSRYLSDWSRWNHVRTVAAIASTTLFALALR